MTTSTALLTTVFFAAGLTVVNAQEPGTLLWSVRMSSATAALGEDGTIYAGGLNALTATGSNKWSFSSSARLSKPAIGPDGTVYQGGYDGKLYAVNSNGTLKWTFDTGQNITSTPGIATDGTIYVGADDDQLYAIAPDGTRKWATQLGLFSGASPVIGKDGTVYIGTVDTFALWALRPDGSIKWSFAAAAQVRGSPAIGQDGTIYFTAEFIGAGGGVLHAVSPEGKEIWRNENNDIHMWPVIGKDGTIYVGSHNPTRLNAIDPRTGKVKWRAGGGDNFRYTPYSAPAVAENGLIYFGGGDFAGNTYFYAFNPDGTTNWQFHIPESSFSGMVVESPSIAADGTIYFGTLSTLYALKGDSPLANSPWPKFRQNLRNTGKVEQPALKQPQKRSDAGFEFQLYPQQLGLAYTIETSTNLNQWTTLTSFVATTLPMPVLDLEATNFPVRFYRAASP